MKHYIVHFSFHAMFQRHSMRLRFEKETKESQRKVDLLIHHAQVSPKVWLTKSFFHGSM